MQKMNILKRFGAGVAVLGATTGVAMADATGAEAAITAVSGDVSTIGWAVIGVIALAAGFKYIRRAF